MLALVEANKFVPKQKGWVFSPPQVATFETLALVADLFVAAAFRTDPADDPPQPRLRLVWERDV